MRTTTLWTLIGADNVKAVIEKGVPCTYRPDASSPNRSPRTFYLSKDIAAASARQQQAPGGRWAGQTMVMLTLTVPIGVIQVEDANSMSAFEVHLGRDVPPEELSTKVKFLRVPA